MGAQMVDYRVSAIVVLCKDCGNDVGLYPARHKCTPVDRPPMPPLPLNFSDSSSLNEATTPSTPAPSMWAAFRSKTVETSIEKTEESIYFNNFAQNLPSVNDSSQSGKKLWGKVRQNDKWKQLSEKNEKNKQSGKLWEKLIQSTQAVHDDRGAESDEDDWDGETHVSRILREHYEKERLPLPKWLFDQYARKQANPSEPKNNKFNTSSQSCLPDADRLEKQMSNRERERLELRQQPPVSTDVYNDFQGNSSRKPPSNYRYHNRESIEKESDTYYGKEHDERTRHKDHYYRSDGDRYNRTPNSYSEQHQQHRNWKQQQYPVYRSQQAATKSQNSYEREVYNSYNRSEERYTPERSHSSSNTPSYANYSENSSDNIRLDTRRIQQTVNNSYGNYL